ncbi:16S rRNA (uracil(1498)-N(3))-methyltransferase [Aliikangiella sp. G2MR2-5]|uniref:16S rRNA (uracil(1498)-N(3))-methyltransferase n=1 Tax=Aliikangiella sp. G2MR2-5 TaxID=2788943 RepID=UPI0018AA7627|nr:16S rRNA (uracil(1498)-N(3))-methyltransferase [Aliikangiella sp. G2MR2-5]
MRSHRFFASIPLESNKELELPKEVSHHCIQVLRYSVGNSLTLFNGDGYDYPATILRTEGKKAWVLTGQKILAQNESSLNIHLVQALAKGDKMDWVIQKCVELGVKEITPVISERSNVKLDPKRQAKKQEHWQKVIESACEQSGRASIPKLNSISMLKDVELEEDSSKLFLEPSANTRFGDKLECNRIVLFVGPEGGFSATDHSIIQLLGGQGVKLGPRILRTETAGLAAIAILQSHYGDL